MATGDPAVDPVRQGLTCYAAFRGCNASIHDFRIECRWASDSGIIQSRHSLRIVPITRSQIEFAFGLATGDRNTSTTQRPDRIIKMLGEDPVSVMDKVAMRSFLPDDFPQLLQRPVRARVSLSH